ncbi:MAG: FliO/MopB family protein [Alkalibacterium sp.]|nr:FliO/MopB family protein [Alkalibacterium sp.]
MLFTDIVQMILALALIIFLANFLLKKLGSFQKSNSQIIKIIERVPVSKSSSLCIVQVESEYMLMSISESSNDIIKTFSDEEREAIQFRLARKQPDVKSEEAIHKMKDSNAVRLLLEKLDAMKKDYKEFQKKGINK